MHLQLLARGEELWQEQAQVLCADLISVPKADHFLLQAQPEHVLETIQQTVEAGRDPSTCIALTLGSRTMRTPVTSLAAV